MEVAQRWVQGAGMASEAVAVQIHGVSSFQ